MLILLLWTVYNISSEPNMLIDFKILINLSHAFALYILMPERLIEMSSSSPLELVSKWIAAPLPSP